MRGIFQKHFFSILLITLCFLFVSASFVRFVTLEDYLVSYEVDCDPRQHSCFVGCEDDDCVQTYTYYIVEKHVHDTKKQCGESIADCTDAMQCQPEDSHCTVTFCNQSDEALECVAGNYLAEPDTL